MTRSARVCTAFCLIAVSATRQLVQSGGKEPATVEKRLLCIVGAHRQEISLRVGDVVQVEPFTFPVIPAYLDAKLVVHVADDSLLGTIGQLPTSAGGEGRTGISAFLYARAPGDATVTISLVNKDGKQIEGHRLSYRVRIAKER